MKNAIALVIAAALTQAPAGIMAQEQPAKAQEAQALAARKPGVPLRVQVVISRYQGEKKIASVPYSLSVTAAAAPSRGLPSQLRMGSRVPIVSPTPGPVSEKPNEALAAFRSFSYENIGTQIDCSATALDDGRYELTISIDDSSIYVDDEAVKGVSKGDEPPIFRQFRSANHLILRNGQSSQFTAATDRISGEVIRVDVTLDVVK